jgi:hypothetical protein
MTFPDDQASPAAPFSGDGTGEIFDTPDLVFQSPTTSERIVDTQSGYLVVVKSVDQGRQSLYVKRRIGTPPSSSVLLTPDESLKLSRVLVGGSAEGSQLPSGVRRATAQEVYETQYRPRYRAVKRGLNGPFGLLALTVLLLVGVGILGLQHARPTIITLMSPPPAVNAFEPAAVEKFSRQFVAEMLDFNPQTYRISQVNAMSQMSPELFNSYWRDTHFPLSTSDLRRIPQGNSVTVEKVTQTKIDGNTVQSDVFGKITSEKTSSPIHLRLKLIADGNGQLRVAEQADVTAL